MDHGIPVHPFVQLQVVINLSIPRTQLLRFVKVKVVKVKVVKVKVVKVNIHVVVYIRYVMKLY